MNILLIGGSGSLINNLIVKLNKEGHRVYLLTGNRYQKQPYQKVFETYYFTYDCASLNEIFERSDIISLHCPLTKETHHLINEESIAKMKKGVVIINTSRGALIDAEALLSGIKARKIGAACLDVYEEESDVFFNDYSGHILDDDTLARLISMPNVIVTSHQAFLTQEALENIAEITTQNLLQFFDTGMCDNELCYQCGEVERCKKERCKKCF